MTVYVRPEIDHLVFRDPAGDVIPYGRRWGGESPPEDTYSVETHPARFAPVVPVALALIDYLTAAFEVEKREGPGHAGDFLRDYGLSRIVRLTPQDPAAAPLTFGFTDPPTVYVHAGLLQDFIFPICGCDACDEDIDHLIGELERTVFAVVEGRYAEQADRKSSGHTFFTEEGEEGSGGWTTTEPSPRLTAAVAALRDSGGRWKAWPRR
ncbi:hypothetical protein D1871_22165 [Nakamurella silvestris]|nr:hypothetical protein D1871_22165 [Nakamurella silvestris]